MKIHFRGNILIVDGEQQICPKGNAERFCRKNCALMQVTEQTSKSLNLEGVTEVIGKRIDVTLCNGSILYGEEE